MKKCSDVQRLFYAWECYCISPKLLFFNFESIHYTYVSCLAWEKIPTNSYPFRCYNMHKMLTYHFSSLNFLFRMSSQHFYLRHPFRLLSFCLFFSFSFHLFRYFLHLLILLLTFFHFFVPAKQKDSNNALNCVGICDALVH